MRPLGRASGTSLLLAIVHLAVALAVFLSTLTPSGTAAAQEGPRVVTDDEVNDVAKDLYCPVCESTPLDVCPTQACADWREVIRTKLSQGQTAEEIRAYFAEQYGVRALAEPPREGFTSAIWILPITVVVLGAVFFARYLRSLQSPAEEPVLQSDVDPMIATNSATGEGEPGSDDYEARIERELRGL